MAWHTGAGMGWWMLFGGFLWIGLWGTVIYLFVLPFRETFTQEKGNDPLDIAKQRYASGQINREEYERLHHDLAA